MNEPDEWFFAFYDPPGPRRWWDWFTRPGFRHVLAFGFVAKHRVWVFLDWTASGLTAYLARDAEVDALICYMIRHDGRVLRMAKPDRDRPRVAGPRWPAPFYCVTAVKHVAGIRSWALTPWQLFGTLQRRGATELFLRVKEELDG
jgi:hypothetical protein